MRRAMSSRPKYEIKVADTSDLCEIAAKGKDVGKSEWPMNFRLNKQRNDVFRQDSILMCQHFKQATHDFNKHAKITIIEQLKH